MVTKDLESILRNESSREGFFNNPNFYFGKSNWKKIEDQDTHIAWQNRRTNDIVSVVKIVTDILNHYYIWRVNKNEYGGIRTEFTNKKDAIDFAAHYRKMHQ